MTDGGPMGYVAWNGEEYDGEPPAGWYLAGDDRWWAPGTGPTDTAVAPPLPPGAEPASTGGPTLAVTSIGTLGNILWLVLAGLWMAFGYLVAGIGWCMTVIGIPFGVQCFKLASFSLWPFGRVVVPRPGANSAVGCVGNVLWLVLSGFWLGLGHLITGVLLCLTVIGIPLGLANFKLIGMAFWPFGRSVVPAREAHRFTP